MCPASVKCLCSVSLLKGRCVFSRAFFFWNLFLIKSKWLCCLFVREVKEIWVALRTIGTQDAVAQGCLWEKKKCNLCPGVGKSCGWVLRVKRWGVFKRSCDRGLLMQTVNSGRKGWDFIFASFTACIQILCCKCKCRKKASAEFPHTVIRAIHYSLCCCCSWSPQIWKKRAVTVMPVEDLGEYVCTFSAYTLLMSSSGQP